MRERGEETKYRAGILKIRPLTPVQQTRDSKHFLMNFPNTHSKTVFLIVKFCRGYESINKSINITSLVENSMLINKYRIPVKFATDCVKFINQDNTYLNIYNNNNNIIIFTIFIQGNHFSCTTGINMGPVILIMVTN